MSILQVNLLGVPRLRRDGAVCAVRRRKALALLAYLAVTGSLHSREELVDLLWPEAGDHDRRRVLRSTLYELRHALGDPDGLPNVLHVSRTALGLEPDGVAVDVHDLATAATLARHRDEPPGLRAQLERAVALYRGPFLADLSIADAPEFETWALAQREAAHRHMTVVLARLAALQDAVGDRGGGIAVLERWVQHDPLEEDAHRRLIAAYLAAGDVNAGRRAYDACRTVLATELGVEPSLETGALAERLQAATPGMPCRPGRHTPASEAVLEPPFVGRAAQLVALGERLVWARQGHVQVVVLAGEAGNGKTRLATEFLAWARSQGADVLQGQAVEMGEHGRYAALVDVLRSCLERENAPDDLLSDLWLAELGHLVPELYERYPDLLPLSREQPTRGQRLFEAVTRLIQALAGRRPVVLFLDDVQWTDGATRDVLQYTARHWAQSGTRLVLLLAVRAEDVGTAPDLDEWLGRLGRTASTTWLDLDPLDEAATIQLVATLAGLEAGHAREDSTAARFGTWLYSKTGGRPLFIKELLHALLEEGVLALHTNEAGIWALDPRMALEEIGRQLVLPPRVQEVVRARLRRLDTASRELLVAGTVVGTRFSFEHLCQVAELPERAALDALDVLVRARVLREEDQEGWYTFSHDAIQAIAYSEAGAARQRVLHRRALAVSERLGTPAADLADQALAAGLHEQSVAYRVAAGDAALAARAVQDAITHYERARAFVGAGGPVPVTSLAIALLGRLYLHLGRAYELDNDVEHARMAYQALRTLAHERWATHVEIAALTHLALLAERAADRDTALTLLWEARHLAEASDDRDAVMEIDTQHAEVTRQLAPVTGRGAAAVDKAAQVGGEGTLALASATGRAPQYLQPQPRDHGCPLRGVGVTAVARRHGRHQRVSIRQRPAR
jgi:DNA-binding SARP family transcriptional activator